MENRRSLGHLDAPPGSSTFTRRSQASSTARRVPVSSSLAGAIEPASPSVNSSSAARRASANAPPPDALNLAGTGEQARGRSAILPDRPTNPVSSDEPPRSPRRAEGSARDRRSGTYPEGRESTHAERVATGPVPDLGRVVPEHALQIDASKLQALVDRGHEFADPLTRAFRGASRTDRTSRRTVRRSRATFAMRATFPMAFRRRTLPIRSSEMISRGRSGARQPAVPRVPLTIPRRDREHRRIPRPPTARWPASLAARAVRPGRLRRSSLRPRTKTIPRRPAKRSTKVAALSSAID